MLSASILRNHRQILARLTLATMSLWALPTQARTLELHADSLASPVAKVTGLHATLKWPHTAASGSLQIDANLIDASNYGYKFAKVHWECPLTQDSKAAWHCEGVARAGNAKPMRLALTVATSATDARLSAGRSAIGLQRIVATPDNTRLMFEKVPAAWLQAFTKTVWANGKIQSGTLDGRLDVRVPTRGPIAVQGPLQLRGLALETPDGGIAVGSLDADAKLDYSQSAAQRTLGVDLTLRGGELLAAGLYAALPRSAITASLRGSQKSRGDWQFQTLRWTDGAVLAATGDARFASTGVMQSLNLQLRSEDLAHARDRYLTGWLAPAGFSDLQLRGGAQVDLSMDAGGLQNAHAQLIGIDAIDGKQRVSLRGLAGDVRWTANTAPVASALRWSSGTLLGIAMGPAQMALHSQSRQLVLDHAASLPMLGGDLRLDRFELTAPDASHQTRFTFGLSLFKLQVAQLAKLFDWPAFGGTLDGSLPSAHYENEVLSFDGGLTAQVFGGKLAIDQLAMERPFGADPSLTADMTIDNFDLKALTGVFGFGEISGRLDGSIRGLRLLNWSPIAFDAELHSDSSAPDRRRISQRAVTDISTIGGGGIAGGLQAQALKLFKDFAYAQLGISCKLANNVCQMGGIDRDGSRSAGSGYTIVDGSGLPHISVIGYAREVDWPTLVARLEAATHGKIIIK